MYFSTTGMGCVECSGSQGMGSIDLANLSWEDYLLVGIGGMMFAGLLFPSIFEPGVKKPKKKRRPAKASTGFAGGIVTMLVLAGGGYVAYRYFFAEQAP